MRVGRSEVPVRLLVKMTASFSALLCVFAFIMMPAPQEGVGWGWGGGGGGW